MDNETWKDIPNAPGYQVSNYGKIRSFWTKCTGYHASNRPKIVSEVQRYPSFTLTNSRYYQVGLIYGGKYCRKYVHQLVLQTFVGDRPDGMFACHADGNRINNRLDNLRWDTPEANVSDAIESGTFNPHHRENRRRGSSHHHASLTEKQVLEIIEFNQCGMRQIDIARKVGTNKNQVWKILNGYSWNHITNLP